MRRLRRNTTFILEQSPCCEGVSLGQCEVLLEIEKRGTTSLVGLVETLGLDKSTLSRTVDGLLRQGLVSRTQQPEDRRYLVLALTPPGRQLCERLNEVNDDFARRALKRIPRERHAGLIADLHDLITALELTSEEVD